MTSSRKRSANPEATAEAAGGVVVVTGAGSGIGAGTARLLAERGTRVIVSDVDLDAARAVAHTLPGADAIRLDVTDSGSIREAFRELDATHGGIDALVSNAGWDRIGPFLDSDEELWDQIIAINLKGQIACAHAVLPYMIGRGHGRIVCLASDAGRVGSTGEVVYSAAKGGVIAFVKGLAREVARHGILVNAIAPGPTNTPFLERFETEGRTGIVDAMIKATPLRRLAEPDDIASAIWFMLSDGADFITGQTLSVSGGLTMV